MVSVTIHRDVTGGQHHIVMASMIDGQRILQYLDVHWTSSVKGYVCGLVDRHVEVWETKDTATTWHRAWRSK